MRFYLILIVVSFSISSLAIENQFENEQNYSIISDYGLQMSGIKKEDFINSNYSPMISFGVRKKINNNISLQIGYQGKYFLAISDDEKHPYNYFFLKFLYTPKDLFNKNFQINDFIENLYFFTGFGIFNNYYIERIQSHAIVGVSRHFKISEYYTFKINLSSIIGWNIYQGDEDILPSISLGFIYNFLSKRK